MLFYASVIFATTALPILAAIVHMGNTGRVFLNRKEVAGVLGAIAIFSGALTLAVHPDDSPRPIKAVSPPFTSSDDAWLRRQGKINRITAAILKKQGIRPIPEAPAVRAKISKKALKSYSLIQRQATLRTQTEAATELNKSADFHRAQLRSLNDEQGRVSNSTRLLQDIGIIDKD